MQRCEQSVQIRPQTPGPSIQSRANYNNPCLPYFVSDIHGGTGNADALYLSHDEPKPEPSVGQALVKIKAFGLNRMDLLQREGKYPLPPQAGKILGVEFSGTIEAFGPEGHESFRVGDAVFGLAYGGAYAEYIAVNTAMLMHKPDHLSWEQAAGIPEVYLLVHAGSHES